MLVLVLLLLSFFVFLATYLILELRRRRLQNYPPGPYPWPLLGNTVEMALADADYPHIAFAKLAERYGPVMGVGYGVHYTVVISSFEIMKEIIAKPGIGARYCMPFVTDRAWGKPNMGIMWNNGNSWQELRRYTVRTLRDFGFGKRSSMELTLQEEVNSLATTLIGKLDKATEGDILIDNIDLAASTVNILWGLVAGFRFPTGDATIRKSLLYSDEFVHIMGYSNLCNPYPILKRVMPGWSGYKNHCQVYKGYEKLMRGIIDDIRGNATTGKNIESFIERFLDEMDRRKGQDSETEETDYTEEQLIIILIDLFIAGSETTSTTLMWLILYLTTCPEKQKKLYEEIVAVVGTNNLPTLEDESRMPYTKACILEGQRMGNVLPALGQRCAVAPVTAGKYTIPQGCMVAFNLHPMFRDKTYWGDPDTYRPERFLERNGDGTLQLIGERAERVAFVFGLGRRSCMGDIIAMRSIFMYVTILFSKFEFSVIPGQEPNYLPRPKNFTLLPFNFNVHLKIRN